MPKARREGLAVEAGRRNRDQLARLGGEVRASRARRGLTQTQLAERVGMTRPTVSALERGFGGGHTLDTWQRVGLALDRPLRVELSRDALQEPADAGHLAIQELVLREARRAGWRGTFELPTRPAEPWRSADVGLRNDRRRLLVLVECWNTIGDIGAAVRSTNRKVAEAHGLAVALFGDADAVVAACWVVRATARNRRLFSTYPETFGARFRGSSVRWLRALMLCREPPADLGLLWASRDARRLYPWRRARVAT